MKNVLLFTFLIIIYSLGVTSCGSNATENKQAPTDTIPKQTNTTSTDKKNQNIFDDTKALTNALSQNGIGTLKDWSNPMEMGWGSLTDYFQFGNKKDGVGMQNNIAYYLEGNEKSAKTLTLNLNINNPADKKNALKFLNEITIKTFNSLNLQVPNGLTNSILAQKSFKADNDNFETSVVLDKSKIETWKVNITRK